MLELITGPISFEQNINANKFYKVPNEEEKNIF